MSKYYIYANALEQKSTIYNIYEIYTNSLYKLNDIYTNDKYTNFFTTRLELLSQGNYPPIIELNMYENVFIAINTNDMESFIKNIIDIHDEKESLTLLDDLLMGLDYFLIDNTNSKELINKYMLKKYVNIANDYLIESYKKIPNRLPTYITTDVIENIGYIIAKYTLFTHHMNFTHITINELINIKSIHWCDLFNTVERALIYIHDFPIDKLMPNPFPINDNNILDVVLYSSDFHYIDKYIDINKYIKVFNNKHIPKWFLDKYKTLALIYINTSIDNANYYTVENNSMVDFIIENINSIDMKKIYFTNVNVPEWLAYNYRHIIDASLSNLWNLSNDFYRLDDLPIQFFKNITVKCSEEVIKKQYSLIHYYDATLVSEEFILNHLEKVSYISLIDKKISESFAYTLASKNKEFIFYLCQNKYITMKFIDDYWPYIKKNLSDLIFNLPENIVNRYYDDCKDNGWLRVAFPSSKFCRDHIADINKFANIPLEIALEYDLHHSRIFVQLPYNNTKYLLSTTM
jgi:hypothetical protein